MGGPVMGQVRCAHFRTDDHLPLRGQDKRFAGPGSGVPVAGVQKKPLWRQAPQRFWVFCFSFQDASLGDAVRPVVNVVSSAETNSSQPAQVGLKSVQG